MLAHRDLDGCAVWAKQADFGYFAVLGSEPSWMAWSAGWRCWCTQDWVWNSCLMSVWAPPSASYSCLAGPTQESVMKVELRPVLLPFQWRMKSAFLSRVGFAEGIERSARGLH